MLISIVERNEISLYIRIYIMKHRFYTPADTPQLTPSTESSSLWVHEDLKTYLDCDWVMAAQQAPSQNSHAMSPALFNPTVPVLHNCISRSPIQQLTPSLRALSPIASHSPVPATSPQQSSEDLLAVLERHEQYLDIKQPAPSSTIVEVASEASEQNYPADLGRSHTFSPLNSTDKLSLEEIEQRDQEAALEHSQDRSHPTRMRIG